MEGNDLESEDICVVSEFFPLLILSTSHLCSDEDFFLFWLGFLGFFVCFAFFVMVYSLKILIPHQKFNSFLAPKHHFSAKK